MIQLGFPYVGLVNFSFFNLMGFFTLSKFWTRNRLGDRMRDKYNLNILDTEDDTGEFIPSLLLFGYVFLLFLVWLLVVFQKRLGKSCICGGFSWKTGVNWGICISYFINGLFEFGVQWNFDLTNLYVTKSLKNKQYSIPQPKLQ